MIQKEEEVKIRKRSRYIVRCLTPHCTSIKESDDGGAGMYASGDGASIYPVYLRIEKPKVYKTFAAFLDDMHKAAGRDPKTQNPPGVGSTTELRNKLKAQGYDGIRFARTDSEGCWQRSASLTT